MLSTLTLRIFLICISLLLSPTIWAGMSYSLIENKAQPGQIITLRAILFNDEANAINWTPPQELQLQWNKEHQPPLQSTATLQPPAQHLNIPVNAFSLIEWQTEVPAAATGIQIVSIEGAPELLAIDTSSNGTLPISAIRETPSTPEAPKVTHSQEVFDTFRSAISTYEPSYFVIGSEPQSNARFQISFKYRLFNPKNAIDTGIHNDFYLGYTQRSLWDLSSSSMPFIDTTYNPSFFWHREKLWQKERQDFYLGLNTGIEHASNGKSGEASRSLNDLYIQPELNYTFDGGSTLSFMPRIKKYVGVSNDNADYKAYMGHIDWKLRWQQDHGLSITAKHQRGKQSRKTYQVDASWPLKRTPLNMNGYLYAQYYKGYGETLLHYNRNAQSQVRFGIAITP